jgi:transposase InsO family protein
MVSRQLQRVYSHKSRGTSPEAGPYRYAILDHDAKFDAHVIAFLNDTGLQPKRTSVGAPWQNGVAERWVGSARRETLDHVIALSESHLRRLIRDYVSYHHEDRIHDSLDKNTPNRRAIEPRPSAAHQVIGCRGWVAFITGTPGDKRPEQVLRDHFGLRARLETGLSS